LVNKNVLSCTPKVTTKPLFSCLLRHPARKWSRSIPWHKTHTHKLTYLLASDLHQLTTCPLVSRATTRLSGNHHLTWSSNGTVCVWAVVRSNSCKNVVLWGCGKLWSSISYFLATRTTQINVEAAYDVDPKYQPNPHCIISVQVCMQEVWVVTVWVCTLMTCQWCSMGQNQNWN